MTAAPPRTHIISRTFVALTAVVACLGFASSALAVTLSEARRIPNWRGYLKAAANDRGVLFTSTLWPPGQIVLDFVPLAGPSTRLLVDKWVDEVVPVGSNGREFLLIHSVQDMLGGILLDSSGVPTQTVNLPAIHPQDPLWSSSVVLATAEGFDVYVAHDRTVMRASVHLDGTASATWQTAATFDDEIGYFDVLNLPGGKILIHVVAVDRCRLCTCAPPFYPVRVAVTTRGEAVGPLDFSVLPAATSPDVEVGSDGRIWLLTADGSLSLTEVREIVVPTGAPIYQSGVIATDTDGPGYLHHFYLLTRLSGGGFLLTEHGPGGYVASLRTDGGYEWERLLISSGKIVRSVLAGPGGGVAFILNDYYSAETEVRFLTLGRTRGASPVRRVRPSRPD